MMEYFIVANSFAAPFCSDTSTHFLKADSPQEAIELFRVRYSHPAGLYSAVLFQSSDDYHKDKPSLLKWLCKQAEFLQNKVGLIHVEGPGEIYLNGELTKIENPYEGRIIDD